MSLCREWVGSSRALFTRRWMWCSLRSVAGAMPESSQSTGRNSVGLGLRQPVMILRVSLSAVSSFFVCVLRHQTGEAYSAVLYTRARAPVRRVMGLAPRLNLLDGAEGCFWMTLLCKGTRGVVCRLAACLVSPPGRLELGCMVGVTHLSWLWVGDFWWAFIRVEEGKVVSVAILRWSCSREVAYIQVKQDGGQNWALRAGLRSWGVVAPGMFQNLVWNGLR